MPQREPLVTGGSQAFYLGGINGFGAAVTAYLGALIHGEGDWVDISIQECMAGMLELYGPGGAVNGVPSVRAGNHVRASWGIYPCADGFAGVCALERQIPAFFSVVGDPELDEPRFRDRLQRVDHDDELQAKFYGWFAEHTKQEILDLGAKYKVPFGAVMTPNDLLENASLAERGFFDAVATLDGMAMIPGRPFLGIPWVPGELHEPGADTAEVVADWLGVHGMKKLPLEGIRVADLTMMWAGPYATKVLAEMGAEVIKIESPRAWDNIRTLIPQPGIEEPWNKSFYFNDYNRDKKSLTLDLAQELGRRTFLNLVAKCDVVIENYRADVLDNLGLGYEVLKAAKPDIILISMAGYGKTGPERDQVGFGPIIEQMSGLASMTGYGDDGIPMKTGLSYGDPVAGMAAASAVALALIQRRKTGNGTFIDLGQREVMSTLIGEAFVAASVRGEEPVQRGNRDSRFFAQGVYRCAGEEQWVAITMRDRRGLARCETRPRLAGRGGPAARSC